jgi:PTH1 family peptidyl-tRNA hydrolase
MNNGIKLFVGLGNPGCQYKNTRHNFGFMVLDEIALSKRIEFKTIKNEADISFWESQQCKAWLMKPTTFMNLSGKAVSYFANYYKITAEEIFVFYDDFSIPLGKYKIRMSGSDGGHNGISSIIDYIHSDKFPRMKLGIGYVPEFIKTSDFVLSKFKDEEKEQIDLIKKTAVKLFEEIVANGLNKAVSKITNAVNNNKKITRVSSLKE